MTHALMVLMILWVTAGTVAFAISAMEELFDDWNLYQKVFIIVASGPLAWIIGGIWFGGSWIMEYLGNLPDVEFKVKKND